MSGWGSAIGKIFDWIPGRREAKESEIARLRNENAKLAQQHPLPANAADRMQRNADRIKQLREQISRIT